MQSIKHNPDRKPQPPLSAAKTTAYQSFMIRIWRSDESWRAAVVDPHSDSQKLFASRDQLLSFIAQQMEE